MDIRRAEIEAWIDAAEEQVDERLQILSPSGRFRMLIRTYHRPPSWDYTRGTVVRVGGGPAVCDIKRNFSKFHHSFVAKDGREYLIAGHSYTSQTIVDLDRGEVMEPPGDHYDSNSFCWARAMLSPDGNTLAVDGCFWACPYEYRFYDFTDPSCGWTALPVDNGDVIDVGDGPPPVWVDDETFECYETHPGAGGEPEVSIRTRLRRDGNRMVLVERWFSEAERARQLAEAEQEAAVEAWWNQFSVSDPMYLAMQTAIRDHALPDMSAGGVPAERRIVKYFRRNSPRASADLIWDLDAELVVVRTYDATGQRLDEHSFDHTLDGITAAMGVIGDVFTSDAS